MVTICAERKKHIRRSAPLKTLEKFGFEILKGERPIIEIGQGIYTAMTKFVMIAAHTPSMGSITDFVISVYLVPSRSADPQSESADENMKNMKNMKLGTRTASGRADARTIWPGTQTAAIPAPCA